MRERKGDGGGVKSSLLLSVCKFAVVAVVADVVVSDLKRFCVGDDDDWCGSVVSFLFWLLGGCCCCC